MASSCDTTADDSRVYSSVKDYYGKVLQTSSDLKTNACTAGSKPNPLVRSIIATKVPKAVNDKFYGCGNPIPLGITGKDILDLGSGSGRDCYIAAALVGPQGSVTGVDMTDEQLETARQNVTEFGNVLGYQPKLKFLTGYIENLHEAGVADNSIDVCISNCVINLSPNKQKVFEGVYQALRPGGELHFSDIYASARVPKDARNNSMLLNEGMGGALYVEDFEEIVRDIGFSAPRPLNVGYVQIYDNEIKSLVKGTKFYSITYRLFKLGKPAKESSSATASHPKNATALTTTTATYLGTIDGHSDQYELDVQHVFKKNEPVRVDSDTADILALSWLAPYFALNTDAADATTQQSTFVMPTIALMQQAYEKSQACSQKKAAAAAAAQSSDKCSSNKPACGDR
ncbi:hypothetical protein GGI07_005598 [Coemansia sp. Benny D115]|nr:hypothetical protein GGI07_005598 [Coemansia sp. Benny D115]